VLVTFYDVKIYTGGSLLNNYGRFRDDRVFIHYWSLYRERLYTMVFIHREIVYNGYVCRIDLHVQRCSFKIIKFTFVRSDVSMQCCTLFHRYMVHVDIDGLNTKVTLYRGKI